MGDSLGESDVVGVSDGLVVALASSAAAPSLPPSVPHAPSTRPRTAADAATEALETVVRVWLVMVFPPDRRR